MVDFHDDTNDGQRSHESQDATRYAGEPPDGYEPHPLFPRDDGGPERRDIQFVSFRRRRSDGRIDNSAEDVPAGQLQSWAQVVGPWGGGEYKAIGKDKNHRVVAWYPEKNGEWILFDLESKPFTLRDQRYQHSPPMAAPAAVPTPVVVTAPPVPLALPAPPAPPAPPAANPLEAAMTELVRELRASRAPATDTAMTEVLNELRLSRAASTDTAMGEVLKELRASRAPSTSSTDTAMVEMIKAQGEMMRTVLSAVLTPRPVEASPRPASEPAVTTLQLLSAMREWAPKPQAQLSVTDRLSEYRAIRELTTPGVAPPPPSEFGEIKDLVMSVVQAEALSKSKRDVPMLPPVPERRPPPPPPPPPPPRAPLRYVPGVGMVEVVQPEAPPPRAPEPPPRAPEPPPRPGDRDVDLAALLRDPIQRERVLNALGIERLASPAAPVTSAPLPDASPSAPSRVPVAVEPAPEVVVAAADPGRSEGHHTASEPSPQSERAPIEEQPTAPIAADEYPAIELPEHMPSPEPYVTTEAERQRAQGSLTRLAKLPRDQLHSALSKLPGLETNIDDLISAVGDLPPSALPFIMTKLPVETVLALAGGRGG